MRALIQRVLRASVEVNQEEIAAIGLGLIIFLGIEDADDVADAEWLARKVVGMRVFTDELGKMNLDLKAVGGEVLVVSQFTLHASTQKGNRPSFIRAAEPEYAKRLYRAFKGALSDGLGHSVASGRFGADMKVALVNDGPVTIWMDSKARE